MLRRELMSGSKKMVQSVFSSSFRWGFTLLELLIVVAVMAILMSLLLPALRTAKETGNKIKCTGNMKQAGTAFAMYSGDFNNHLPPSIDGADHWWCRDEILGPYWGSFKPGGGIMRCPSSPDIPINHAQANYVMNTRGNIKDLSRIPRISYAILIADSSYPNLLQFDMITYAIRVAAFRHVNSVNCLFVDGHVDPVKGFCSDNVFQGWQ